MSLYLVVRNKCISKSTAVKSIHATDKTENKVRVITITGHAENCRPVSFIV